VREPGVTVQRRAGDAAATRALGACLAAAIVGVTHADGMSVLITLVGDLGAGKTTFVGGMLQALGHDGPVRSPTYTLIEPYRLRGRDIQHCDLYRLRHPDELEDLGLRDLRHPGSILLVEWPEKAGGRLGLPDVTVELRYVGEDARQLEFRAGSAIGADIVSGL
jgi:tRNA threonylcarbamoyladenosine biosynthesis protein TsaE